MTWTLRAAEFDRGLASAGPPPLRRGVVRRHEFVAGRPVRVVELEGWNHVSRVAFRNHVVLETHERRAHD